MGLSITGYVLEPPRVGQANSSYTSTPNVYISDQAAFDIAYPTDESEPRTDYHVFVLTDGDFPDCTFCWTKNEVIDRFDYDGKRQRFKTSPGAPLIVAGTLGPDSNTNRLQVSPPTSSDFVSFPLRLSVGSGVGTAFTVALVANDGAFGTPAPGTVELSIETGNLNWAAADLVTYDGLDVRFQQQQFFDMTRYNGRIGLIEDTLLLNPLPATGQYPLIRISTGTYLTPVEVVSLGTPSTGTVQWNRFTGELRFNSGDAAANAGKAIYYDGVVFAFGVAVSPTTLGTVNTPGTLWPLPPEASDLFFRVPSVPVQFAETLFVDTLSLFGQRNKVEVRRSDGQIQFSFADRVAYGSLTAQAVVADLDIERGMTLRMFRSPADPEATDPLVKDVSALYVSEGATLADPTIGSPFVTLPALPVETEPLTVYIHRGLSDIELPRLDVAAPSTGVGFVLDIESGQIQYARRKVDEIVTIPIPFGVVQLPDPVIFTSNLSLSLENGPLSGTFVPLTIGQDVLFDYGAGLATMVETDGSLQTEGSGASFNGTLFTDLATDFIAAGVISGDLLLVLSGSAAGVYTIDAVGNTTLTTDLPGGVESGLSYEIRRGSEILADRYFKEVPNVDPNTRLERLLLLGVTQNAPRLTIDTAYISVTRFRFGLDDLIPDASVSTVPTAGSFTAAALMTQGTVEIAEDSGELNFSQADVDAGQLVFWARTLTLGADYQLQPANGFIELTDRMLELEQVVITYTVLDANDEKVVVQERGSFIVRKELTQDHPVPTDTLYFNPLGREVAENPPPKAFRGGRPQVTGEKVVFDLESGTSSVRFLPYEQVTDALPSGATVNPNEHVYIDYFVHEAIGGEKTLSVLQPPMVGALINIEAGQDRFILAGDRTGTFRTNYLLRVDREEVYLIGSSTYDSGTDLTTITLASPQTFRSDFLNPGLAITSGATRTSSLLFFPSYFTIETDPWDTPSRGASKIRINGLGDLSRTYRSGTVLMFTDGGTFVDFNLVTGSVYNEETGKTEVVMTSNTPRQYNPSTHTLKRSVRPVLESPLANTTTSASPILTQPYGAYRRVEGEVGQVLTQPEEFNIDDAGNVTFRDPLQDNEELAVFYTGTVIIEANRRLKASYTHGLVPTDQNNLLGVPLKADYTTYAPDSFYWRVETFTQFRGELVKQYEGEAEAAIPTGGPILENAGGQALYEKGRESSFYEEGRLFNEDEVARATLVYFNDAINYLEDALQSMDGRVVGDHDGRFLFDGLIDNPQRTTWASVTNQIDDLYKVSDAPVEIVFSPFSIIFKGTYQEVYKAANISRFYPTQYWLYSMTADPAGLATGDTILDLGKTGLSRIASVSRRLPWAVVKKAALSIESTLQVDNTDGSEDLFRPAFDTGAYPNMLVVIQDRSGAFLVPESAPLTVSGKTSTSLSFTTPIGIDVPVGATVRHISYYDVLAGVIPPLVPYLKTYRLNFDVGVDLKNGLLTHIQPFPPFDGSFPAVPVELNIVNPGAGEVLDALAYATSATTEPFRPPALDGSTTDDDGNRSFPILNPSTEAEAAPDVGYLDQESSAIADIQLITTAPFIGIGDLDVTRTIITNQGGAWPVPAPKVYDLVTINNGLNGPSTYRQIITVGVSTITVGAAFTVQDTGFNFTVTTSNSLVTRPGGTVNPFTRLTDAGANFYVAGVKPGHTVVFTSGAIIGERRQVTAVVSATELDIEATLGIGVYAYRIDDSVPTFGGTNSILDDRLVPALDGELAALSTNAPPANVWNERDALEKFLDLVFTDIVVSTQGETSAGLPGLYDATADFVGPDPLNPLVTAQDFVFIRSSTSAGIYQVLQVNSPTSLDIDGNFPNTGTGISYRIVSSLGATITSLESIYAALARVDQAILNVGAFKTLVTTPVVVVGDTAFARRTTNTDLNSRLGAIVTRQTQLNDPSTGDAVEVSEVMVSKDKLYDRRWVWIDARINQEKGILPKKDRAVAARQKAQADTKKQLIKLLTMRL